jgi:hypothetical protein
MRALPDLGRFDLVWALNDAVNYVLSTEELQATMAGLKRNLAPDGVALFDLNTPVTYRTLFSQVVVVERNGRRLIWEGQSGPDEVRPNSIHEARFEVEGEAESRHVHQQRHFTEAEVLASIEATGLRCDGIFGELGGALSAPIDEEKHTKAVYLCRP